jgi:hypothetical protein
MVPSKLRSSDIDGDNRDELLFEGARSGMAEIVDSLLQVRFAPITPSDKRLFPARTTGGEDRLLEISVPNTGLVASLYTAGFQIITTDVIFSGTVESYALSNVDTLPATEFVFAEATEASAWQVADSGLVQLWRVPDASIQPSVTVLADSAGRTVFIDGYGYVNAVDGSLICAYPDCIAPGVDWDRDGIPDGGGLSGASSIQREDAPHFTADTSWVIDLDVNGTADLLGLYGQESQDTTYIRWIAAKHTGGLFRNFPMAASGIEPRAPFEWTQSNNLYFVSEVAAGGQYSYSVVKLPIVAGPGPRFAFRDEANIINVDDLNPQVHARPDWLYCWPNPTSDVSRIRVTTAYPAQATVKVFDLSGRKVADLSGSSSAAGPFEILWDVSNVESGVYIGEVKVTGGGSDERAQVKIAVVK